MPTAIKVYKSEINKYVLNITIHKVLYTTTTE